MKFIALILIGVVPFSMKTPECENINLPTGWYYVLETSEGCKRMLVKSTTTYFLDVEPIVTSNNFTEIKVYQSKYPDDRYYGLSMKLDEQGTQNWSNATRKSIHKQLAFVLDNELLYVAKVNAQINSGMTALNRGTFSRKQLKEFKKVIEAEK